MIQGLLDERNRIDATIAKLEALQTQGKPAAPTSRRGRKAMSMSEREEVSRRMRNYWDQRRRGPGALDGAAESGGGSAAGSPVSSPADSVVEEPVPEQGRPAVAGAK